MFLKLFQKIKEGIRSSLFYDAQLLSYQIQKLLKKENYKPMLIVNIYRCKYPQQNITKLNSTIYKKGHKP